MAKKKEKPQLRKAIIKKNKNYKFGKSLSKGQEVLIQEQFLGKGRIGYTAFANGNMTLGFSLTKSEFEYTEKEKYVVCVTRASYSSRNIEVEAMNREEAKQLATEEAGNLEFSEHDVNYTADAVFTSKEHNNFK